jgi:hypothetical protein
VAVALAALGAAGEALISAGPKRARLDSVLDTKATLAERPG